MYRVLVVYGVRRNDFAGKSIRGSLKWVHPKIQDIGRKKVEIFSAHPFKWPE